MLNCSCHSFHICDSMALISVRAIAHVTSKVSSAAMLSGDDASACTLVGVDDRARFGELGNCNEGTEHTWNITIELYSRSACQREEELVLNETPRAEDCSAAMTYIC